MDKLKLYCYADETGPDTKGKMFLVAVVITTSELVRKMKGEKMSVSKVDKLHLSFGWGRSLEDYEIEIKALSSPQNLRLQLPDEIKDCLSDYLSSDNELEQLTSQHFSLEKEYRKQQDLKQSDLDELASFACILRERLWCVT